MNWQSLIADLKKRDVTQTQIAALCGCKQSSISDLATGNTRQPNFQIGQTLTRLHAAKKRELDRLLAGIEAKVVL